MSNKEIKGIESFHFTDQNITTIVSFHFYKISILQLRTYLLKIFSSFTMVRLTKNREHMLHFFGPSWVYHRKNFFLIISLDSNLCINSLSNSSFPMKKHFFMLSKVEFIEPGKIPNTESYYSHEFSYYIFELDILLKV